MFKPETIAKFVANAKAKVKIYSCMNADSIKLSISKGNSKIGKVMNVSILPILSCGNCSHCSGYCYDVKANIQYTNVLDARSRNYVLATLYRDEYFKRIDDAMNRRRTNKYFRWHVGGEILDFDYFCRMVENAKRHPDFIIWTYTKMHYIVNAYCDKYGKAAIPNNFIIMFSEWDGMPLVNPYNFPIFTCRLKDGNKNHSYEWFNNLYKCPGNCDICKSCGGGCIGGMNTFADEH